MDPNPRPSPAAAEAHPAAPPAGRWSGAGGEQARRELVVGAILLAVVALGGLYLRFRPESTAIDGWLLDLVRPNRSGAMTGVTGLRLPQWIVTGAVILAAVAFPKDRLRSLTCLVGPPTALATCELVVKPLIGRHLGTGLSYPSGSSVGAAALATAAVLAVPDRWRTATAVLGAVYVLWMSVAVVALQWHYPTDALAGAAYGACVVLLVDAAVWRAGSALGAGPGRGRGAISGGG